jgi:hypothetical protein
MGVRPLPIKKARHCFDGGQARQSFSGGLLFDTEIRFEKPGKSDA